MTDTQIVLALLIVNLTIGGVGAAITHRPRRKDGSIAPSALDATGDSMRRRRAKRFNEHLKLTATLLNNAALAGLVSGILGPVATGSANFGWAWYAVVFPSAGALLMFAHLTLRFWQSEE